MATSIIEKIPILETGSAGNDGISLSTPTFNEDENFDPHLRAAMEEAMVGGYAKHAAKLSIESAFRASKKEMFNQIGAILVEAA